MKLSFKEVPVRTTLNGEAQIMDLRMHIAEAVYQNAANFEQHKLAHRIAETDGEIELNEEEANVIKRAVKEFRFFVQKPILEALGENFE